MAFMASTLIIEAQINAQDAFKSFMAFIITSTTSTASLYIMAYN